MERRVQLLFFVFPFIRNKKSDATFFCFSLISGTKNFFPFFRYTEKRFLCGLEDELYLRVHTKFWHNASVLKLFFGLVTAVCAQNDTAICARKWRDCQKPSFPSDWAFRARKWLGRQNAVSSWTPRASFRGISVFMRPHHFGQIGFWTTASFSVGSGRIILGTLLRERERRIRKKLHRITYRETCGFT